jgi:hypothetical protein
MMLALALWAGEAMACGCDDSKQKAARVEEAYREAELVFEGEAVTTKATVCLKSHDESRRVGDHLRLSVGTVCDHSITVEHVVPGTALNYGGVEYPYSRYATVFSIRKLWKDTRHRVNGDTVSVAALVGGWCGFQFAEGEKYLVYARGTDGDLPSASLCSRTRPLIYATDDMEDLEHITQEKESRP